MIKCSMSLVSGEYSRGFVHCDASGSEGFEEWVETLDRYLAEITNSLPSGLVIPSL